MQNTAFSTNKTLNLNGRLLNLATPKVMGILNVTPDSFYDGGKFTTESQILKQVEKMLKEGADIIDVGGSSTRPGAKEVDPSEESTRVLNAIRLILQHFSDTLISVDTFRAQVARAAVAEGATMVNDVSGGQLDEKMFNTVADLQVPYVLMHMRGTPQTMTTLTHYDNLVKAIIDFFQARIFELTQLGVKDIIIDPGFGFAKTREQNFTLLSQLGNLSVLGRPVLAGLSRKSLIWKTLNVQPEQALNGTSILNTVALLQGASILRVHDVREAAEAIKLVRELREHI